VPFLVVPFPPAAFHSEAYQDGMGVCLFFALVKRRGRDSWWVALGACEVRQALARPLLGSFAAVA